jgi:hypothetical protein
VISPIDTTQPGESYRAIRTGEFNLRTSENLDLIGSIEATLKSVGWPSKIMIFNTVCSCDTFMIFLVAL